MPGIDNGFGTVNAYGNSIFYIDSLVLTLPSLMTNPLPLSNPTMVTAAVEVRRQDTATVSDIRVAWSSVANAQSYTVRLYPGAGNVSDISALYMPYLNQIKNNKRA